MFAVVKFDSDGSVQLVPSSWISKDKRYCKWPGGPCKNISHLIKQRQLPPSTWNNLSVKFYKTCDNYTIGKVVEKEATVDPELNSTDSDCPKFSTKTGFRSRSSKAVEVRREGGSLEGESSDSESNQSLTFQFGKTPRTDKQPTSTFNSNVPSNTTPISAYPVATASNASASNSTQHHPQFFGIQSSTQDNQNYHPNYQSNYSVVNPNEAGTTVTVTDGAAFGLLQGYSTEVDHSIFEQLDYRKQSSQVTLESIYKRQIAFEETITRSIEEIKTDVQELLRRCNSNITDNPNQPKFPVSFPLSDISHINELETWVENDSNSKALKLELQAIGGKNCQKIVSGILVRLFSKEVGTKVSWAGSHQKLPFKSMKLCKIVFEAVKANKLAETSTNSDIKVHVQNWFSNTRDLNGGRKQRANQDNVELQDETSALGGTGSEIIGEHAPY